jgi:hypothetical protein
MMDMDPTDYSNELATSHGSQSSSGIVTHSPAPTSLWHRSFVGRAFECQNHDH